MSRLIVKNLPKTITEEKIKQLFSEKGTVTDIQLKYTKDGKFRQFAFIGYQTEEEAQEAIKYFDLMFIQTSKIKVEACASLGDANKPKAWSKYATDSTAFKKSHPVQVQEKAPEKKIDETVELLAKYKDDPLFEEFLQIHAPNEIEKLKKIAKNESAEQKDSAIESGQESGEEVEEHKLADQEISDLEYMKKLVKKKTNKEPKNIELFTLKLKDLPYNCKKKEIKQFFKPVTPFSIRLPTKIHGIAYVGFKTEKDFKKALLKDRSFISGKRVSVLKYTKQTSEQQEFKSNPNWKNQEESLKNEEDIAESGRIFLRNLSYTTVESDIEQLFVKFGPLVEVNLPVDATTRKIKGFGTVTYLLPEHAVKAYAELDGSVLHGRMLHLLPGKSQDTTEKTEESSDFKAKKAAKQKAQAGSGHNWNSLFLGHDAVAEVVADTCGTTKENVWGPHEDGAAVRLALGETQIVAQTRKYLEKQGVVLDCFNAANTARSKTVILVKNLPARTEINEIKELFCRFGVVGRVIMPPSGVTAIVEFMEPSEARKAFTRLAYSKFKSAPLYLEWAPDNSLKEKPLEPAVKDEEIEDEVQEEPEPDTTLFVKNLNFHTTDESLRKHFEPCGKIAYATVALKKDKNDPKNRLSMGYGFVRFVHKSSTDKALKTLQQTVLDGKSLELKRSERTLTNEVKITRKTSKQTKQTGTKILVKNVPFQANVKEIRDLFSVFGEIKALRLPKKMALEESGSHRGFAFVDYATTSEAKSAFEALSQSTHLYGRRLVLEWASTAEGVEEIRKRTAQHFVEEVKEKKSKKSVFNID